jgi:hypothetical protein
MKKLTLNRMLALAMLVAGTTWLFTGCGTSAGYKQADKTGQGMAEFREEIVKGKKAIDGTMASLNQIEVTAVTNPRKAYEQFCKSVSNLDSVAAKAKKRGADMQQQGQAYFAQWEQQMAQVQDPAIRKLAQERQAKLRESFDNIKKYTVPLKSQFDAWMSDLKGVQSYLGLDMTVAGVNAAKDIIGKTKSEGLEVQKSMDALIAELNSAAATITPADVKPQK